jgi:chemotaxis protein CheD
VRHIQRELTAAVKLLPGEYFASAQGSWVTTLLGSCVSVCLFDIESGVGGMNHFMLPGSGKVPKGGCPAGCTATCSARYGSCAMRLLLRQLQELGAVRSRLVAKLFGAGRVLAGTADIGAMNAAFALQYLKEQGIPVLASDLGDTTARKVIFCTATGEAYLKKIGCCRSTGPRVEKTGVASQ